MTDTAETGWQLVPKEPTEAMLEAALDVSGQRVAPFTAQRESGVALECDISEEDAASINEQLKAADCDVYRAMLSAAPPPPAVTADALDAALAAWHTIVHRLDYNERNAMLAALEAAAPPPPALQGEVEQLRAWQRARLETGDMDRAEIERLRVALRNIAADDPSGKYGRWAREALSAAPPVQDRSHWPRPVICEAAYERAALSHAGAAMKLRSAFRAIIEAALRAAPPPPALPSPPHVAVEEKRDDGWWKHPAEGWNDPFSLNYVGEEMVAEISRRQDALVADQCGRKP